MTKSYKITAIWPSGLEQKGNFIWSGNAYDEDEAKRECLSEMAMLAGITDQDEVESFCEAIRRLGIKI